MTVPWLICSEYELHCRLESLLTVTNRQIRVTQAPLHYEMTIFMYNICRIYKKNQIIISDHRRCYAKFVRFLQTQQRTKLRDF